MDQRFYKPSRITAHASQAPFGFPGLEFLNGKRTQFAPAPAKSHSGVSGYTPASASSEMPVRLLSVAPRWYKVSGGVSIARTPAAKGAL